MEDAGASILIFEKRLVDTRTVARGVYYSKSQLRGLWGRIAKRTGTMLKLLHMSYVLIYCWKIQGSEKQGSNLFFS